ncbi:hypothetical protein [Bosea massiliensis]|uniref:Uncharacterized protein n=1 Tax=Bosea massiliensis TaxID=151419 RepID=A0ABW0NW10_9HYPH
MLSRTNATKTLRALAEVDGFVAIMTRPAPVDRNGIDLPNIKANVAKLSRRRAIGKAALTKSRPSKS